MLNWAIPCGQCFQCVRGKENICEQRGSVPDDRFHAKMGDLNASFSLGTMATHAIVPQAAVLKLPEDVPIDVAAIMGCAVMTGFGSAVNAASVTEGSTVVVLGCGGVGLSTILGALHRKAARVIAVDVNPVRLTMASQFGATDTLLADRADEGLLAAAKQVKLLTSGRGADYAFECTAVPELGPAPLRMIRSAGTAIGVSGIEQVVSVDMELFEWDKTYINPLYGACRPQRDFPLLIDLYLNHGLPLDALVTRRYPLEDLEQAFDDMHRGINAKGVLIFV
jgi:S-(hydroxymethyl)glutathione dehydrogenase/alcohol dehydrogenase